MHRPKTVHFQVVCPSEVSQHQSICFGASRIHGFFLIFFNQRSQRSGEQLAHSKRVKTLSKQVFHHYICYLAEDFFGYFHVSAHTYSAEPLAGKKNKDTFLFFFAKCWMMVVLQKANFKSSSRWRGRLSYQQTKGQAIGIVVEVFFFFSFQENS